MTFPVSFVELPPELRQAWDQCWHLGVAFLLAVPIGWDREKQKHERTAGIRTFPLVAIASCGIFLIGEAISSGQADPISRVIYGVVTGIGFLGGGAILKEKGQVTGLTTAASLWNTAAIGLAAGADQFGMAAALSAGNFLILRIKPHGPPPPDAKAGPGESQHVS
jgi:putative Mg2+ transporter-C (MgtC) family protein